MAHVIHHHPKRDEVFDRALQLKTIHEDTRRVAKLLDHAALADEIIDELAESLRDAIELLSSDGSGWPATMHLLKRVDALRNEAGR